MEITGSYFLPCSPETAWKAMNDPDVLKACLKGCEALERTGETEFTGRVAAKIGPVSARFTGTMRQTEIDAPNYCRMQFDGQGGIAGFAKGGAHVTLTAAQGGTQLDYVVDTQIGGKLAQMGARLVEGTAKSMADDFFGKFASAVENMDEGMPINAGSKAASSSDSALDSRPISKSRWLIPSISASIILLMLAIIYW
jgi:carbon monoxide dehydrogenase subunit G